MINQLQACQLQLVKNLIMQLVKILSFFPKFSFLKFSQTLAQIQQNSSTITKIQILSNYITALDPDQKQESKKLFDFVHKKISTGISDKILLKNWRKRYPIEQMISESLQIQKNKQTVKEIQKFIPEDKISNNMKLQDINSLLQKIVQIKGDKSIDLKMNEAFSALQKMSFIQSRYFLRILTKDMKIGMKSTLVEKSYSDDPLQPTRRKTNIKVAQHEQNNQAKVLQQFKSFSPMLARPLRDIQQFEKFCTKKNGTIIADVKYDGQRTIISFQKGKNVVLISRNGKLQNQKYVKVSKQLQTLFEGKQGLSSLTLDAEILAVDTETQQPLPFQVLMTRKRKVDSVLGPNEDNTVTEIVYVFDVLQYNGKQLQASPLIQRKELIFQEGMIKKGEYQMFKYPDQKDKLMDYFNFILKRKYQGLILKGPQDHYYKNGTRIHWGKLKKSFRVNKQDKGSIDLDLIVMGGDYGRGKKEQYLSSYLVGVKNGEKIIPLSRVGSGFADQELDELTETFRKKIIPIPHSKYQIPASIKMDVWFNPEQVVEIDCQQLTRSPLYEFGFKQNSGGISLRFPVFKRLRSDKTIQQATDGTTILQEMQKQEQTLLVKLMSKKIQSNS